MTRLMTFNDGVRIICWGNLEAGVRGIHGVFLYFDHPIVLCS